MPEQLLKEIEAVPISMIINEQNSSSKGRDLRYLMEVGLVDVVQEHLAQDSGNNRYRFSRSSKALD